MVKTPIWKDIEQRLSHEISEGRYAPGDKLPTEAELSARFGVNRHTVRRALADLQESGLTHSRRGAGVFVAAKPVSYPLGRRVRFSENLERAGQTGARVIHRLETIRCSDDEAAALHLNPGAMVHVSEGVSLADGAPLCLSRSVFPAARLPGLLEGLRHGPSVTEALRREGVYDYVRTSTQLTAHNASATQAVHLKVREGAALLRAVSVNADLDGNPIEFGYTWFVGDRIRLTVDGI